MIYKIIDVTTLTINKFSVFEFAIPGNYKKFTLIFFSKTGCNFEFSATKNDRSEILLRNFYISLVNEGLNLPVDISSIEQIKEDRQSIASRLEIPIDLESSKKIKGVLRSSSLVSQNVQICLKCE